MTIAGFCLWNLRRGLLGITRSVSYSATCPCHPKFSLLTLISVTIWSLIFFIFYYFLYKQNKKSLVLININLGISWGLEIRVNWRQKYLPSDMTWYGHAWGYEVSKNLSPLTAGLRWLILLNNMRKNPTVPSQSFFTGNNETKYHCLYPTKYNLKVISQSWITIRHWAIFFTSKQINPIEQN